MGFTPISKIDEPEGTDHGCNPSCFDDVALALMKPKMLQIRPANPNDFDELLVLFRQLWPAKTIIEEQLRAVFIKVIATPYKKYFCALSDGRVVGLGAISFKDNLWQEGVVAYVEELVVLDSSRGQGIGTELLNHLFVLAREHKCKRIELDSAFHRLDAHRLYERVGFEKRAFLFSKML